MAEVNKISSFKSFSEIKAQENEMKLREENTLKKQETLVKIEEILDEMGLTSLSEIDEDSQKTFISKLLGREMNEGNTFIFAAAKAKQEGKEEFEFNGKKYKVTLKKDTGLKEGNAFGDAVKKAKEAGESEFEFDGETYKVEEHLDEAISRGNFDRMDGLHTVKAMDALINAANTIFADLTEEMFEFSEIVDFITMKLNKSKLAKTYESYDVTNEDFIAKHSCTDILLKKGYKNHTEAELQELYLKIGELVKDNLDVKQVTVVFESKVNEAEIKSDDEFKEYAMTVLKKAFGAEFDEAKAEEVADGILKKCDGDYGACVGMLTSSLGESFKNNLNK